MQLNNGWLLSSGNALPARLRQIALALRDGDHDTAKAMSEAASRAIEGIFSAVGSLPFGNAFSNANRAADHVLAWGDAWPHASALTVSGRALPQDVVEAVAAVLASVGESTGPGYLQR